MRGADWMPGSTRISTWETARIRTPPPRGSGSGRTRSRTRGCGSSIETSVERRRATLERLLRDVAREQRVSIDAVALSVTTLATIEGYYQLAASTDLVPTGSAAGSLRDTLRRILDPEPRR